MVNLVKVKIYVWINKKVLCSTEKRVLLQSLSFMNEYQKDFVMTICSGIEDSKKYTIE